MELLEDREVSGGALGLGGPPLLPLKVSTGLKMRGWMMPTFSPFYLRHELIVLLKSISLKIEHVFGLVLSATNAGVKVA